MDAQSPPASPRKSRVRERQQRRKSRQTEMAAPAAAMRGVPRHLSPTGGLKLPRIELPYSRVLLYALAGGMCILLVIFALGQLKNDAPAASPNAIWLGTQWTYDLPADDTVAALVNRLRDNRVGTIYAWVSLLQPNGAWSDTIRIDGVRAFVEQIKRLYPEADVYAWLSVAAQGDDGSDRLDDLTEQQTIADFSLRMVTDLGFDGVFLNVVPVLDGNENYLQLLRKVRATIGQDALLAVAVPPDWTPADVNIVLPPQIAPGTVWDEGYKQRVALLADQITVMAYNSGLSTPADYSAWVAYQVDSFASAIAALDTTTQLLIGVPTYDTRTPDHDPMVENLAAAVDGIRAGLTEAGDAGQYVRGVAVYAEWETSLAEWDELKSLWVNPGR